MPKKRSHNQYSKPPSVAPTSLSLSSSTQAQTERHDRSVNQILADLRRSTLSSDSSQYTASYSAATAPSVPPTLRHILQIPDTPAPAPRRAQQRRDLNGRRIPPGPPPPPSWIVPGQTRHAPQTNPGGHETNNQIRHWPLPDAYAPAEGSLVDNALKCIALDWTQQREWNKFHIYTLPSRLRSALLYYVAQFHDEGMSLQDLRLVLLGPTDEELAEYDIEPTDSALLNEDIISLDLTGSLGRSLTLKELNDLLFGSRALPAAETVQDSWDAPAPAVRSIELLPNLTHLSLAIEPGSPLSVSWKQLLMIAGKLSRLIGLSLAGWPEPSLTPNAKFAKVTSKITGLSVQYGGTGPYSHNLDADWSEAVLILKRLSKVLYRLEYLDLTGCGDWPQALRELPNSGSTNGFVDWVGDWGKITTLRLNSGYSVTEQSPSLDVLRIANWINVAVAIEKHIWGQRSGRGRWITVERDSLPDGLQGVAIEAAS